MTRALTMLLLAAALSHCDHSAPADSVPTVILKREKFSRIVEADGSLRPMRATPVAVPQDIRWPLRITWLAAEGSAVKKGDPVARFDDLELRERLAKAEAERTVATAQRQKESITLQAADSDRLRLTQASERDLLLTRNFARKDPELFSHDDMIEGELDEALQQAKVDFYHHSASTDRSVAQRKLGLRDVDVRKADEQVRRSEQGLKSLQIAAPHDGVVVLVRNENGDPFRVGDTVSRRMIVAEVSLVETLEAEIFVLEAETANLAEGRKAEVILESQGGQPIGATVKRIEAVPKRRQSKSPTQYFGVMLTLEKTLPDIMKPGQRVRARLFLHEEEALVAPRPALFDRDGHFIVYRLASGGLWSAIPVTLGPSTAGRVIIKSGLLEGDRIALRDPGKSASDLLPVPAVTK
jgi:multidrug efflux pump subunit AcrA (membrane-fusion protein)